MTSSIRWRSRGKESSTANVVMRGDCRLLLRQSSVPTENPEHTKWLLITVSEAELQVGKVWRLRDYFKYLTKMNGLILEYKILYLFLRYLYRMDNLGNLITRKNIIRRNGFGPETMVIFRSTYNLTHKITYRTIIHVHKLINNKS